LASTDTIPTTVPGADSAARRVLLFRVGTRVYGCEIDAVREIIPWRRATRLPGAPAYVCGLINLRGTIITVLDLEQRLGAGASGRADGSIVLVQRGARTAGVGVDEVMDVQPLPAGAIETVSGDQARDGIVRGIGHLGDGTVVILLDMHTLVRHVLL
jgi:purine-binding chemotaxis protein CheW